MIGGSLLPVALLAWIVFVPYPFDPRMLVMLCAPGSRVCSCSTRSASG